MGVVSGQSVWLTLCAGLLAAAPAAVSAQTTTVQTNVDYWVREMSFHLTIVTNGPTATNGIIAELSAPSTPISSQAILQAINGSEVLAIGKALTNYTTVSHHVTNQVTAAYLTYTPVTFLNSPRAIIEVVTPLAGQSFAPFIVVCPDPSLPQAIYSIDNYLQMSTASFNGAGTNAVATSGRLDTSHGLAVTSSASVREFIFNSNDFGDYPPSGTYFDVQGFTTEQSHDVIQDGVVLGGSVPQNAASLVAGTGQLNGTAGFGVLRGTITLGTGRHEFQ